tara:strand:- start:480 stop:1001 length:522 start_codon:yes stop_codon:yes gene_type:complete
MPAPVELRCDFDALSLRALAKRCRDVKQSRRLLSIAGIYDGMNRYEAAKIGGMDRQILRDWVLRFNDGGPEGLRDRKAPGAKWRLNDAQMKQLDIIVKTGPDPAVDGVVRWRCCDLVKLIAERFGVSYKERAVSNLLKELDFSRISGRPQHPKQDTRVIDAFKKTSPTRLQST